MEPLVLSSINHVVNQRLECLRDQMKMMLAREQLVLEVTLVIPPFPKRSTRMKRARIVRQRLT